MKRLTIILVGILIIGKVYADIAPNPIVIKGIYTIDSCKIQMTQEYVYADLYNDSAIVECTFELLNLGDSTTIQIGFPEMNFQYWSMGGYAENDKANFKIHVNGRVLTAKEIVVPAAFDSIYNTFMYVYYIEKEYRRKTDSIYIANNVIIKKNGTYKYQSTESYQIVRAAMDDLYKWRQTKPHLGSDLWREFDTQMKKGNFPWYVWNVHFDKNEKKTIKIVYSLPSGQGYGANYRYFKYILETGSGWYGLIEQADIELKLHDIEMETLEEISPKGHQIDIVEKLIKWNFTSIEPTKDDDIYVRYYNPSERRSWEKYQKNRKRAMKFRFLNPLNWFK
ncbi:MAG: hypothetical protein GYA51_02685 [Candidatus Methanofastidiosa archaeon]|nr:hypothetical protein [Candidatus Methanofastidiosa archaeon]